VRAAACALVVAAAACAGELEQPERFASCPPGFVEQLFSARCAGECHAGGDAAEAALDLVAPGVEARLIGEPSATPFCDGRLLVEPDATHPGAHLLLDKLAERPSCGARMPFGGEALTASEVECVRRWIDEALGRSP
jgi:hypothetical protein